MNSESIEIGRLHVAKKPTRQTLPCRSAKEPGGNANTPVPSAMTNLRRLFIQPPCNGPVCSLASTKGGFAASFWWQTCMGDEPSPNWTEFLDGWSWPSTTAGGVDFSAGRMTAVRSAAAIRKPPIPAPRRLTAPPETASPAHPRTPASPPPSPPASSPPARLRLPLAY